MDGCHPPAVSWVVGGSPHWWTIISRQFHVHLIYIYDIYTILHARSIHLSMPECFLLQLQLQIHPHHHHHHHPHHHHHHPQELTLEHHSTTSEDLICHTPTKNPGESSQTLPVNRNSHAYPSLETNIFVAPEKWWVSNKNLHTSRGSSLIFRGLATC